MTAPALVTLVAQWRNKTQIKDLGELGAAFPQEGYNEEGFRPLRRAEVKLLGLCADELETSLADLQALVAQWEQHGRALGESLEGWPYMACAKELADALRAPRQE